MPAIPDWTRAFGEPEFEAQIRVEAADFQVTECLDYPLSGDGEHDFLWLEKQDANTLWVAGKLARHAGIRESDVGFAGMKDRHAITRQWFSIRRPSAAGTDWEALDLPGVRILERSRHSRKLRRGAHSANRFRIALRDLQADPDRMNERLSTIRQHGVPNYFGEQRFGHDGGNLRHADALFAGKKLSRNQRSIAISAARSWLFNHILQRRVRDGSWNRLQPGDFACLDGSNSLFAFEQVDAELRQRTERMDIHPGGALWGSGDPACHGDILALEQEAVAPFDVLRTGLESHARRSQRALRLAVRELQWELAEGRLWLEFTLTRGGFATAVLREITRY